MKMMKCVMKSWIDSNNNWIFKPNSFNRVEEEDWIHRLLWEPLNLISNPLWIDRVSRMGLRERHFNTRYTSNGELCRQSTRGPSSPRWIKTCHGLRRATPNLHDQDRLYFTLSSNRLTSNFQGWGLRAGEWREGGARLDALFNRLAQALNSNEQFEMDDSFQLSITQVHHAPRGSGRKRHTKPGHQTLKKLTTKKHSVIRIQNDDVLCCARALVTAKAIVDQHPKCRSFKEGKKLQKEQALLLHHEAHVPFGPCSYEELVKFSAAPSLYDYQILLVDADRSFHVTSFTETQPKQLILLHEKDHYDVITSLPGFFGSSYACAHCLKPYDHAGRHRCPNNNKVQCRAFLQYPRGLKATKRCHDCHRDFFGDTCFEAHLAKDHTVKPAACHQYTICFRRRRCPICLKLEVGSENNLRHRCGYFDCPSCHEYVDAQTHRCFIQRALTPQEIREQKKKRKRSRQGGPRAKRGAAAGLQTL